MDAAARPGRTSERSIVALDAATRTRRYDQIVTEEPLELRLGGASLAVTMRTPGNDFELAAGFVTNESIVPLEAPLHVTYCVDADLSEDQRYNVITIGAPGVHVSERFERHFTVNSSCGVCGRAQLDDLRERGILPIEDDVRVDAATLYALGDRMRDAQRVFEKTGALHAAALFDARGTLLCLREDVGRHNAVDKVVGWGRLERKLPFSQTILFVSGRASYEIVQKAAVARIPIVAAVSAPSSLAVDVAATFNITLCGFVRGTRANIYTAFERIIPD